MASASNVLLIILNVIFLVAGVGLLGSGAYFHFNGEATTVCQKLIVNSLLGAGAFVALISLLGLISSCCQKKFLLGLYMVLMFVMILGLVVLAVFVFLVTNKSAGKAVSGHGVGDYSNWLQNHFATGKNWAVFKDCLVDAQFCKSLASNPTPTYSEFLNQKIDPLKGGCCMPPRECGFEYWNATLWTGATRMGEKNNDCKAWSNKQDELCFNCNTCKVGFLSVIRKQWRNLGISFCVLIAFTLIVFLISTCAVKNNSFETRLDRFHGRYA